MTRDFYGDWGFQLECGVYNLFEREVNTEDTIETIRKGCYSDNIDLSNIETFYFLSHDDIGLTNKLKAFIISRFYA